MAVAILLLAALSIINMLLTINILLSIFNYIRWTGVLYLKLAKSLVKLNVFNIKIDDTRLRISPYSPY